MNKIREKTRQVKKALRDSRTAVKLTAFFLASITILGTLAGSMLSTYASYSQQTVTELQGGGASDSALRALGHDGSLSADVVDNQTYATLDFTAQFNIPAELENHVAYYDAGGIIMKDGTAYTQVGTGIPRYGVGYYPDGNYAAHALRVVAGDDAVRAGDYITINGVNYLARVKRMTQAISGYYFLTESGRVYYTGSNECNQTGRNTQDDNTIYYEPVRVFAGDAAIVPGSDADWELMDDGQKYLANISNIASLTYGCMAMTTEGAVYMWGRNYGHFGMDIVVPPDTIVSENVPRRVWAGEADSVYGDEAHVQRRTSTEYGVNKAFLYGAKLIYNEIDGAAAIMKDGALYHWGTDERVSLQDPTKNHTPATTPRRTQAYGDMLLDTDTFKPQGAGTAEEPIRNCIVNATMAALDSGGLVRLLIHGTIYVWGGGYRNQFGFAGLGGNKQENEHKNVWGKRMWAGEAALDGNFENGVDSETGETFSYISNVARLSMGVAGVITKDGKLYACGINNSGDLGIESGGEHVFTLKRIPVKDTTHLPNENYYVAGNETYLKYRDEAQIPSIDTYMRMAEAYNFGDTIVMRGDFSANRIDDGNPASTSIYYNAVASELVPQLTTLEIYRINDPTVDGFTDKNNSNGNRLGCLSFRPHRNRFDNLEQMISVKITQNGWYRAYYVIDTDIQYYIDIEITDILEDDSTIRPPDTTEMDGNEAIVGYDTFTKRAIINLRSEYNANAVKDLSAGNRFTAMAAADGTVFTWGDNTCGQLGNGAVGGNSETPLRVLAGEAAIDGSANTVTIDDVQYLSNITQVICGTDHIIAIASDGRVYTWGRNHRGQLGDGSVADKNEPVRVLAGEALGDLGQAAYAEINPGSLQGGSYLKSVVSAGAGDQNSGFILASSDGKRRLYTCGDNTKGQLGAGVEPSAAAYTTTLKRVQGGDMGRSTDWDSSREIDSPETHEKINNIRYNCFVIQVDFGAEHMVFINATGVVYCAGSNEYNQLGTMNDANDKIGVPVGTSNYSSAPRYVNAYESGRYSLTLYGLYGVGGSYLITRAALAAVKVSAYGNYTVSLGAYGEIFGWGENQSGVFGTGLGVGEHTTDGPIVLRPGSKIPLVENVDYNSRIDQLALDDGNYNVTLDVIINAKNIWAGDGVVVFSKHDKLYALGDSANGLLGNTTQVGITNEPVIVMQGGVANPGTDQIYAPSIFALGATHAVGLFIGDNDFRQFAAWGTNAAGELALPVAVGTQTLPSVGTNDTIKNYVYGLTNATYVIKSYVRKFGTVGDEVETTIDTRSFGSFSTTVANTTDNPDGMLNHDIIIYENGYYTVEYWLHGNKFFDAIVFTSEDELARYNAKQSDPSKKLDLEDLQENSHILDAPLKLIDLEPVQFDTNLTVPSAVDYTFYLRPVFDNTETDSATLPHTDWYDLDGTQDGDISETLYIYGPQPVRGSESDEEYKYYTYGDELLRITPDGTYVDGDTSTSVDIGLKERYLNASAVTKRFDLVNDVLPVHTPGTYVAVLVRDGKIVDVQTVDLSAILHVKYVVEGTDENLVVPTVGNLYMRAHNLDGSGNTIASYNKQMTAGDADGYTTFSLPLLNQQYRFRVQTVVPSYYEVDRVMIGDTESGQGASSDYTVDFKTHFEYWVTVYMKPSTNDIRLHYWDYRTGRFRIVQQ